MRNTSSIRAPVGGYEFDGYSEEYGRRLAAELQQQVKPLGWFVAKVQFDEYRSDDEDDDEAPQIMTFIDLFPLYGEIVRVPRVVYHVAPTKYVDEIRRKGLLPARGGNDFTQTENARVYVCLDIITADGIAEDMRRLRDEVQLTLLTIDTAGLTNIFHRDVEIADGSCAWTPEPIPASAITEEETL